MLIPAVSYHYKASRELIVKMAYPQHEFLYGHILDFHVIRDQNGELQSIYVLGYAEKQW